MAQQYLYQLIMDVPGLKGTWKERLAQYYKQLTGKTYKGTQAEGEYMLAQIAKKNYGTTTPKTTTTSSNLASQYAQTGVNAGNIASQTPQFEKVLPFLDAWGRMIPQATQTAASQIDPELMRTYKSQYNDYMAGMTGAGGERFGRGLSGLGALKAETERSRNAQLNDWLNQYQQGYKELFYEPSRSAWNAAITQGQAPDQTLKNIPTWEDAYQQLSNQYQTIGSTPSPLYG